MLRDDADRDIGRRALTVLLARERLDLLHERLEDIGAIHIAGGALQHLHDPLETGAGVDVLLRERHERAIRFAVVLLEHKVPDLEVATAVLSGIAVVLGHARLRPVVDEDLAVGSAESGRAGGPEVGFVAEPEDLLGREELEFLRPDVVGLVVADVHRGDELRAVEPEDLGQKLPAPLDRFLLAVIADREVAEHLEERLVVTVLPHLVDVRGPEDLLHRDDPLGRRLLLPGEVRHERLHAGAREEDRRVVLQDERPAGHARVPLLLKEGDESLADGRAVQFALLLNENAGRRPRLPAFPATRKSSVSLAWWSLRACFASPSMLALRSWIPTASWPRRSARGPSRTRRRRASERSSAAPPRDASALRSVGGALRG